MVKIRLTRIGKKNAPYFRIIAIDSRKPRDGAALDILGTYNPVTGKLEQFHADRVNDWVAKGAQLSDSVKKLTKMYKSTVEVAA